METWAPGGRKVGPRRTVGELVGLVSAPGGTEVFTLIMRPRGPARCGLPDRISPPERAGYDPGKIEPFRRVSL